MPLLAVYDVDLALRPALLADYFSVYGIRQAVPSRVSDFTRNPASSGTLKSLIRIKVPPLLAPPSSPHLPIQHPIVDRLVQMIRTDFFGVFEVGDGAGDSEDFVVGSGGEAHFVH